MTGFGRAVAAVGELTATVEARSVNHRFLEVSIHAPRELASLEGGMKALVQRAVRRGKVDLYVKFNHQGALAARYRVDEGMLAMALALSQRLVAQGLAAPAVNDHILAVPGLFVMESEPSLDDGAAEILYAAVDAALQELALMRKTEGVQLRAHMLSRVADLRRIAAEFRRLYPESVESFRVRLKERVASLLHGEIPDERLALETAIAAEKTSIEEEWERLSSHLQQLEALLQSADAVGRRIDFFVQEMAREVNTMGAKSSSLTLTDLVIDAKHALEQLREQAQNVE